MEIRRIEVSDFEAIYKLNLELNPKLSEFSPEQVKERIRFLVTKTEDIVFVVVDEGAVVGYIHGSPYVSLFSDTVVLIKLFIVSASARGQGIGGKLLESLEAWSKERGFTGMRLNCRADRLDTHRFYLKHGYVVKKDQKNFVKDL